MRVLHVYRTYFPDSHGGLEEVIRQICVNSRPLGVDSRVLALSAGGGPVTIRRPEARVFRAPLNFEIASCSISVQAFHFFRRLSRWADVVHYHYPWPFGDLLHFWAPPDAATVVTYHSDIVRQRLLGKLYAPLMNRFLGSVDRIVCTSPNYLASSDVLPRFRDKVDIVPIGLNEDTQAEVGHDDVEAVRRKFGSDFFLFVGVLRYYKGLHFLLDAVKGAPYKVLIVGSGPTEDELKRQAAQMGLTNVVFTGYVPDKIKVALFRLCRGVVFPSHMRSEAFGVTLLEGAIYSRALISTEMGSGTSHVNVDEDTGLVVPAGSASALRGAMDRLHAHPDQADRMGKAARKRYESLFTGGVMGKRYVHVYQRLLGQTSPASGTVTAMRQRRPTEPASPVVNEPSLEKSAIAERFRN